MAIHRRTFHHGTCTTSSGERCEGEEHIECPFNPDKVVLKLQLYVQFFPQTEEEGVNSGGLPEDRGVHVCEGPSKPHI